ncbi:MAG: DUF5694 domain-containing protein [Parvularculaceae bacterium]
MKYAIAALCCAISTFGAAGAYEPAFHPERHAADISNPTEILVLGAAHLQREEDGWDPSLLEPLLKKLETFKPDAIMIEALPGESVDALWRYRATYPDAYATYGSWSGLLAAQTRARLSMDMPEAEAAVRKTLRDWPKNPGAADRRKLAALFIAAGDPYSALVQWRRLPETERKAEDGWSKALIESFEKFARSPNEGSMIGSALAARLGLERIYPIDDHASDDAEADMGDNLEKFFSKDWVRKSLASTAYQPARDAYEDLSTPEKVLNAFRVLNAGGGKLEADYLDQYLQTMLAHEGDNRTGRAHIATLETRNLRQVANIREKSSYYPGGRILVIIGGSHKPWFEHYLSGLADVKIVDASEVLK